MQWRDISEAPRDGCEVLVTDGLCNFFAVRDGNKWRAVNNGDYNFGGYGNDYTLPYTYDGSIIYDEPTHYLLMDAPPTASGDNDKGDDPQEDL